MYRRRRYYYGKARKTVRRYKRRYTTRKAKPKSLYDKVHLVKRFGSCLDGTTSGSVVDYINNPSDNKSYRLFFRLSAVVSHQDFTALYDQYKIRAVKVSFIPMVNITSAEESGYASLIYSTYDFNGESDVPTKDQIREYQYCKWSPYGKIHKRYFFPRVVETLAGSATGSSNKVGPQNWISTANNNIPYYGLLVNVSNVPSIATNQPIYKVEVKYYLSFRNTK